MRRKDLLEGNVKLVFDFANFNEGYRKGIEAAAAFVSSFDSCVNHDWLLSECILSKFNIMSGRPRRNKRKHVIVGIWDKK